MLLCEYCELPVMGDKGDLDYHINEVCPVARRRRTDMEEITCACGKVYKPQDIYAKNRHEATLSHVRGVEAAGKTPKPVAAPVDAFNDLDDEPADVPPPGDEPSRATKPKTKVVKVPKVVNVGDHKACRVCKTDKPLTEFRVKNSRPDGRDTICAVCAKAYDEALAARKAAAK